MEKLKYIVLILLLISCQEKKEKKKITSDFQTNTKENNANRSIELLPEPDLVNRLKNQKRIIDILQFQKKLTLEILVKEPNKEKLTTILNNNWPKIIETTYRVWKNEKQKILLISESPFNQNKDFSIEYLHYFDKNKKTFAIQRSIHFFNSACTIKVVSEKIIEYYNTVFNKIERDYSLTDENKKELNEKNCIMNYDSKVEIYSNLKNYLNKINHYGLKVP